MNMQNIQKNMQNMQAMCRFSWYCSILHAICKICKIICTICKICKHHFRYAEYALPTLLMSAGYSEGSTCPPVIRIQPESWSWEAFEGLVLWGKCRAEDDVAALGGLTWSNRLRLGWSRLGDGKFFPSFLTFLTFLTFSSLFGTLVTLPRAPLRPPPTL